MRLEREGTHKSKREGLSLSLKMTNLFHESICNEGYCQSFFTPRDGFLKLIQLKVCTCS